MQHGPAASSGSNPKAPVALPGDTYSNATAHGPAVLGCGRGGPVTHSGQNPSRGSSRPGFVRPTTRFPTNAFPLYS